MKIAVVGAGAVGGFLGGLLARAGHDVSILARGAHLSAIEARGLEIRSPQAGNFTVNVRATDQPGELGSNELVIVGVKLYDFAAAAQATAQALAPAGAAITIQNGLDAPAALAQVIGSERVLTGTASIEATVVEPGVIGHLVPFHVMSLSEMAGPPTPRLTRLVDDLKGAGINVSAAPDGMQALWDKAIVLIPFATATTAASCGLGALAANPESSALVSRLFEEVAAVAHATGYDLSAAVPRARALFEQLSQQAPRFTSSMNRDMQAGKRIELEWLTGRLVRLAGEHGVPVPAHALLYAVIEARLAEREMTLPAAN